MQFGAKSAFCNTSAGVPSIQGRASGRRSPDLGQSHRLFFLKNPKSHEGVIRRTAPEDSIVDGSEHFISGKLDRPVVIRRTKAAFIALTEGPKRCLTHLYAPLRCDELSALLEELNGKLGT